MKHVARSIAKLKVTFVAILLLASFVAAQDQVVHPVRVQRPVAFDVSAPVGELVKLPVHGQPNDRDLEVDALSTPTPEKRFRRITDPIEQTHVGDRQSFSLGLNELGLGFGFPNFQIGCVCMSDENLAVGDTQVAEYVNVSFEVFDKASGNPILGPIREDQLWAGLPGNCATDLSSDVIVQWDKAAHRWLFLHNTGGYQHLSICIAVSTTPDATGSYYRYEYPINVFWDYPKWGVWNNGYYQTYYSGYPQVNAFDRAKMLNGDPSAEMVNFQLGANDRQPLPADIDSTTPPPGNEDEFLIGGIGVTDNAHLSLYSVHVDWMNPQNSTITGINSSQLIEIAPFTPACNGDYGPPTEGCIPQLGTDNLLTPDGDRLMYRFAYSNDSVGAHVGPHAGPLPKQHWLLSHTVTASAGQNSVRWYEFVAPEHTVPVTALTVAQQGTYAPDAHHRFQSSIARDKAGDILVGYTVSGADIYPEIAVAGRTLSDPLGTLGPEQVVFSGTAPQNSVYHSWGDYSSMALDAADGCTFWYVGMYYTIPSISQWSTRIASAKFPNCGQ